MCAMPLLIWLPYIVFSAMVATPKADPAPAWIPSRD
jgi:hypothetical protein